jgi:hypothetical protein
MKKLAICRKTRYNKAERVNPHESRREPTMPRPGGTAKFPLIVAAAVDADLLTRLDRWAAHQEMTKSELLRALIQAHVPDLRKLTPRLPRHTEGERP